MFQFPIKIPEIIFDSPPVFLLVSYPNSATPSDLVRCLKRNLICSQNSEKTDCDSRGCRRWVTSAFIDVYLRFQTSDLPQSSVLFSLLYWDCFLKIIRFNFSPQMNANKRR